MLSAVFFQASYVHSTAPSAAEITDFSGHLLQIGKRVLIRNQGVIGQITAIDEISGNLTVLAKNETLLLEDLTVLPVLWLISGTQNRKF